MIRPTSSLASKERKKFLRNIQKQHEDGTLHKPQPLSVNPHVERWLARKKTKVEPNTYSEYAAIFERYIYPLIGDLPLTELNPWHVRS